MSTPIEGSVLSLTPATGRLVITWEPDDDGPRKGLAVKPTWLPLVGYAVVVSNSSEKFGCYTTVLEPAFLWDGAVWTVTNFKLNYAAKSVEILDAPGMSTDYVLKEA